MENEDKNFEFLREINPEAYKKALNRNYQRNYYKNNKEKIQKLQNKYRMKNKDKINAIRRNQYREKKIA